MAVPDLTTGQPPRDFARPRPPVGLLLAGIWLLALVIASLASQLGAGDDPLANDYSRLSLAPSATHLFGTDNLGRDVLSRSLHGAAASGTVALTTIIVGGGIGILLGVWAGYARGVTDTVIGFVSDVTIAVPGMLLVATVVTLAGPSLPTISLVVAMFSIPVLIRLARAATLAVATENFVIAARVLGASRGRVLVREVLPSVLPMLGPYLMTSAAASIVAEGALSFLGFGLRPPEPSWGGLIAEGRNQLATAPWVALFPAAILCLTILAINVMGEHLRKRAS